MRSEETTEEEEKRIEKYTRDGERHFTEDGRIAKITIVLV